MLRPVTTVPNQYGHWVVGGQSFPLRSPDPSELSLQSLKPIGQAEAREPLL